MTDNGKAVDYQKLERVHESKTAREFEAGCETLTDEERVAYMARYREPATPFDYDFDADGFVPLGAGSPGWESRMAAAERTIESTRDAVLRGDLRMTERTRERVLDLLEEWDA